MFSALLSFLGGSAFRLLFGEISSYFTKKQDHKQEVERMRLQGELDGAAHARNLEAIRVQAELGVKTIQVQADAAMAQSDAAAFAQAVRDVGQKTGVWFIDVWNGAIRPALATVATGLLITEVVANHGVPTEHVLYIADAILGVYVADRQLSKRGK